MATEKQEMLLSLLPSELAELAVDLSERAGVREYCFPIRKAYPVLESLLAAEWTVLGGDLWIKDGDAYHAAGESWYVNLVEQEPLVGRIARTREAVARLFHSYLADDGKYVTFIVK